MLFRIGRPRHALHPGCEPFNLDYTQARIWRREALAGVPGHESGVMTTLPLEWPSSTHFSAATISLNG